TNTAYYINKNAVEAINGEDENAFTQRWGGQIVYDNFTAYINQRAGGDYGVKIEYGKNITGIQETISRETLCTRIVPKSYNGYMLEGDEPWVDSPLINSYPTIFTKVVEFEDVKLTEDADGDEESFDTLEDLRKELIRRSNLKYSEEQVDVESVTLAIDIILLQNTAEYEKFKDLENISLGDTVHCSHYKLGIETDAQAISITYNSLTKRVESVILGSFQNSFFNQTTLTTNKISQAIRDDGSVNAHMIQGIINAANAQLKIQNTAAKKQSVRAILFEDLDPDSELFGALSIGTQGFQIANQRTPDDKDWQWTTAGTANGFVADVIAAGTLRGIEIITDKGKIGAFNIDDGTITYQGGLFADYIGSQVSYRVFMQPAYYDSEQKTAANTWAFSTQKASVTNGEVGDYGGTFIVYADGSVEHKQPIYLANGQYIRHGSKENSNPLIGYTSNGNIAVGSSAGNNGNITLYTDDAVNISVDGTKRFYFNYAGWIFPDVDTSTTYRPTISSTGALVLDANKGNNAMYLYANTAHAYANFKVHGTSTLQGNTTVQGTLKATTIYAGSSNTLEMGRKSWTTSVSTANRDYVLSSGALMLSANDGDNALYLQGSSFYLMGGGLTYTGAIGINASGKIVHIDSSALRFKENIKSKLDESLNPQKLYELSIKQFNFKDEYKEDVIKGDTQIGFIADDVAEIYPNAALYDREGQVSGWNAHVMIPAMLKLIQEQKQQIDDLSERVKMLENNKEAE
ncbi:MAG: phage tail spike protein, partial [Eubacterium sp.]